MENKKTAKIVIALLAVVSVILIVVIILGIGSGEAVTDTASGNAPASDEVTVETGGAQPDVVIPDDYDESDFIDMDGADDQSVVSDSTVTA